MRINHLLLTAKYALPRQLVLRTSIHPSLVSKEILLYFHRHFICRVAAAGVKRGPVDFFVSEAERKRLRMKY